MQSVHRDVPISDSSIRVALVQLRSPFAGPKPDLFLLDHETVGPPEFVWADHAAIAKRVGTVARVLDFLETYKPHVIGFPEYAVPSECHTSFQDYADKNSCIIVAGSYYERDQKTSRYRNITTSHASSFRANSLSKLSNTTDSALKSRRSPKLLGPQILHISHGAR